MSQRGTFAIAGALAIVLCMLGAAFALFSNPASALGMSQTSSLQAASLAPGVPSVDVRDGTYRFSTFSSSAGVVHTSDDGPAMAIVNGDDVTLVLDVYDPNKFDGLWRGKRSEAPADPYDPSVIGASLIPAGDYQGATVLWADEAGLVGKAGESYKASRFIVPMSKADFLVMLNDGSDRDFYYSIRRGSWSPSNQGKWMGVNDNYFTLKGLVRVSDSTAFEDVGVPTGVVRVKTLIDALPYDPYQVQPSDADAIMEAHAAFEALPQQGKDLLDAQEAGNGVLSFGRTLECAYWGLQGLSAIDDTTSLADGTYTTQFTSSCNMGKSTSSRGFKFTVTKIEVKDGHAKATLEHATASPDTLKSGGIVYPHVNEDETAKSTFEIPIDLNSTFYVSQMAKNKTSNTFAIPFEMSVEIDEGNAVPDVLPAAGGDSPEAGSGGSRTLVGKVVSAAAATRQAVENSQQANGASADGSGAKTNKNAAVLNDGLEGSADDALATVGATAKEYGTQIAAIVLALLVAGVGAFSIDYRRREMKPVQIRGVGLSGEHA